MKIDKLIRVLPLVLLTACGQSPVEENPETEATDEVVAEVPADVPSGDSTVLTCTGEVIVPADARISIHAPVRSTVGSIYVIEGQQVRKGEALATLQHMEIIRMQEDYLKAKSGLAFSEKEYERKRALHEKGVIPDREFEQAESTYLTDKAGLESLKKQLRLLGVSLSALDKGEISESVRVVSPVNGVVTKVLTNHGSFANQDTPLIELVDASERHIHLSVFASDIHKVHEGQEVLFRVAGSDKSYTAKITLIGKSVDLVSKTVSIHAHLKEEAKELVIGTTVFAEINLKPEE